MPADSPNIFISSKPVFSLDFRTSLFNASVIIIISWLVYCSIGYNDYPDIA